ncbi:hypothetical protein HDU67_009928 [Dinochytrium kinnereticum]|nr:hypothetical protein HDU67_009928 [Dinochytrium kinnereticum]
MDAPLQRVKEDVDTREPEVNQEKDKGEGSPKKEEKKRRRDLSDSSSSSSSSEDEKRKKKKEKKDKDKKKKKHKNKDDDKKKKKKKKSKDKEGRKSKSSSWGKYGILSSTDWEWLTGAKNIGESGGAAEGDWDPRRDEENLRAQAKGSRARIADHGFTKDQLNELKRVTEERTAADRLRKLGLKPKDSMGVRYDEY